MSKPNIEMAISELHKAFHMFNKELFNGSLPEPAILIQSKGNKKNVLGWCSVDKTWVNNKDGEKRWEINLVSEFLYLSLEDIMCTLLHEMIHLYCSVKGIKDTSRNYTYHNRNFKNVAEDHGLIITYNKQIGWSFSKLKDSTKDIIIKYRINPDAFNLSKVDPFAIGSDGSSGGSRKPSSVRKWVCPGCSTIIRSTKDVRVICADCEVLFVKDEGVDVMDE